MEQRLRRRTGEALRGRSWNFTRAASRSSSEAFWLLIVSRSAARLTLNFLTVSRRFLSRLITASLAMASSSGPEREAERGQQGARLFVGSCSGGNADVHAAQRVDLVVVDLGKNDLFLDA